MNATDTAPASTIDTTLEVLTLEQAARLLQIPVATFRGWRERHYGPPGHRVGKHLRFIRSDIIQWVREQGTETTKLSAVPDVVIRRRRAT